MLELAGVVHVATGITASAISFSGELDTKQTQPSAAIYPTRILSTKAATRGSRQHVAFFAILIYRTELSDLESDLYAIEDCLEAWRKAGGMDGVKTATLTESTITPQQDNASVAQFEIEITYTRALKT